MKDIRQSIENLKYVLKEEQRHYEEEYECENAHNIPTMKLEEHTYKDLRAIISYAFNHHRYLRDSRKEIKQWDYLISYMYTYSCLS